MNELTMTFNTLPMRAIIVDGEPWFVGADVATILGYKNSRKALADHVDDDDKGVTKRDTLGGVQEMTIINEPGVYSLIFSSKLPAAKEFKRWVTHEVLPSIRKQGFYSMLSDQELVDFITERQKQNPSTLDLIDKTKIKRAITQEIRDKRLEETRQLWALRFGKHEQVNVPGELRRIWQGDMPMYHKYLDQFHADENRERKGHIITI